MRRLLTRPWTALTLLAWGLLIAPAAAEQIKLGSICRVKGQEERVLQGLGVVVGLPGTGDGALATTRQSVKQLLDRMGNPVGAQSLKELKDFKNVALVVVTATIPAAGARQGDKIDCIVSSFGAAKSLKGGRLLETAMTGPGQPPDLPVYAFAQGSIQLEGSTETTARIHGGCRMEEDFFNPYSKDGKITLVLNNDHSGFGVAQDVAERINARSEFDNVSRGDLAKAIDQNNIEVNIPPNYRQNPVMFVAGILNLELYDLPTPAQVTINQRTGSIVITADVEIGAVVVTHKNFVIEAGTTQSAQFVGINPGEDGAQAVRLRALLDALKAVHAPTEDIIDIIKGLAKSKKLHAKLIIE
ncbi:MAG: flagellar basal body P-ring protein FlgI [Pirellulales bacterium]|nr:flagellar basal body P-ring protein FlgI [Pirellulales bacterium]